MGKRVFVLLVLFLTSGFSLNDYQKTPKTIYNLRQIVSSYSENRVMKNLREFVSCCKEGRLVGTQSHQLALPQIKKQLAGLKGGSSHLYEFKPDIEYALSSYENQLEQALSEAPKKKSDEFEKISFFIDQKKGRLKELKKIQGKNLIWEKKGIEKPDEVLLLMAHYDNIVYKETQEGKVITQEVQMPGADKNASGVALLISMAEVLDEVELPKTVRLIFLDFGEFEGLGAKSLAKEYSEDKHKEKLFGALNVMMVGHSSKNNHEEKREHDMRLYYPFKAKEASAHQKLAKFIKKLGDQMGTPIDSELESWERESGGQSHFWKAGLPAFLYSQNWEQDLNPRIHTSNDFVETLNFKTLHGNFRYLTGAVLAWAFDLE